MSRLPGTNEVALLGLAIAMGGGGANAAVDGIHRCFVGAAKDLMQTELPALLGSYRGNTAQPYYEAMGIKVFPDIPAEDGFVAVEFQEPGWQIEEDGNYIHYYLVNPEESMVATILAKLDPWDRSVLIQPRQRFIIQSGACCDPHDGRGENSYNKHVNHVARVVDRRTPWSIKNYHACRLLWESNAGKPEIYYEEVASQECSARERFGSDQQHQDYIWAWALDRLQQEQKKAATEWLNENYPDWKNPVAYWKG